MNFRPRAPFLAVACAAVALSACGSSSSSGTSSPAASTPAPPASTPKAIPTPATVPSSASTVILQADPSGQLVYAQKTLKAKAGKVVIAFTNQSPVPHDVAVEQAGGKALGTTPVFNGGSKALTLTLAKGTYTFYCSVDSHRQAGMQGTLTVN